MRVRGQDWGAAVTVFRRSTATVAVFALGSAGRSAWR